MNGFLQKKIDGLKMRIRYAKYGIFYFRSSGVEIPEKLFLGRNWRPVKWANKRQDFFRYEFNEICIKDCYKILDLGRVIGPITRIVDVGANQGLFLVAARRMYPTAVIYCYEPNPNIIGDLTYNANSLHATVFAEAVTKDDCKVSLSFGETDLHSTTKENANGDVIGTSFRKVIERAGGMIDLLKMDCEGAEWDLFDDKDSWSKVKCITMEYHLWAKPGSTVQDLVDRLNKMGFRILHHDPLNETFGLLTAIKN